ncbi:MAG: hypothetical protein FWG70_06810 [Oscillospiraceae bacterium]|nr:hypothetical protein [Oscillospiraceae bacterium]
MLTLSLIFSFGGDAPSLFGRNIYIVKTDAMELLKPGTAIFTRAVPYSEIHPGDIVVFKSLETNRAGIAEIVSVRQDEGVYRYAALSERDIEISLTQGQIVGKATQYSDFFGVLIGFAKSPAGVLVIAVIPCVIILIYESSKSIFAAFGKESKIDPVKKQDEVPTYLPRRQNRAGAASVYSAYSAYSKQDGSGDDSYEKTFDDIITGDDDFAREDYPLFKAPGTKPAPPPEKKKELPRTAPLSQKRLNQAIAEVNARKIPTHTGRITGSFPYDADTPPSEPPHDSPVKDDFPAVSQAEAVPANSKTSEIKKLKEIKAGGNIVDNVRRYTPKKNANQRAATVHTSSAPSLDRLLRDDDGDNTSYNIEDILFSIERKK